MRDDICKSWYVQRSKKVLFFNGNKTQNEYLQLPCTASVDSRASEINLKHQISTDFSGSTYEMGGFEMGNKKILKS
jgi:hypothetical protein